MEKRIVLIEDEERLLDLFLFNLKEDFAVKGYLSGEEFFKDFNRDSTETVVTDVRLPAMDGLEVLRRLREAAPEIPVIIITAFGSINQAVSALKLGAYDYLTKPVNTSDLKEAVLRARAFRQSTDKAPVPLADTGRFLTWSPPALEQVALAVKVAPLKVPVLILGETGTGKELIAEMIHAKSGRPGPLVIVNCAAIPGELMEGELFGYCKGAFTGAAQAYAGKLRLADRGTLFLDEIGEMPEPLQAKLLRILETESFYPIGDNNLKKVDLRIIAASNRDLKLEAEEGKFRKDLYYRLAVIPVRIPPLRERKEDIEPLARHFFPELAGHSPDNVEKGVYSVFRRYPWPGNVRELKNLIIHLGLVSSGAKIKTDILPEEILEGQELNRPVPETYEDLKLLKKKLKRETLEEAEREFLGEALKNNRGNITKTAAALDMDRRQLQNLLKKYGLRKGG